MPVYRKKRKLGRKPSRKRYGRRSYRTKSNSRRPRGSRSDFTGSAFRGGSFGGMASAPPLIVAKKSIPQQIKDGRMLAKEISTEANYAISDAKDILKAVSPFVSFGSSYFGMSENEAYAAMALGGFMSYMAPSVMPTFNKVKEFISPSRAPTTAPKAPSAPKASPPPIVGTPVNVPEVSEKHTLGFDGWTTHTNSTNPSWFKNDEL